MADAAVLTITPNAPLDESVFTPGSYTIENTSSGGVQITSVKYDISTALFPGLVFDPSPTGSSGNELGKPFTIDQNIGGISATSAVTNPYQGEIGQLLTVTLGSFDPSDKLAFSIDIDPGRVTTSDPAAGPQGKMNGLELVGTTVTVGFSDGTSRVGEFFTDGSVGGSRIVFADPLSVAPTVSVAGASGGVGTLADGLAHVTISGGPANGAVRLLVVRGIYELVEPTTDPYEANRATNVHHIDVALDANGSATLNVDLSFGGTDGLGGGIFHFTGAAINGLGEATSLVSDVSRVRVATDADLDADGDGLLNGKDRFQLDAANGAGKNLAQLGSVTLDFASGTTPFQAGFTGVMSNGQESHTQLGVSGSIAGGRLSLQATAGDANGALNTQKNGYQFGVDVSGVQSFTVETKVFNPFLGGVAVQDYRQAGLQIGAGNQDDYAKLVFSANHGGGGIEFLTEMGYVPHGVATSLTAPLQDVAYAMLYMDVAKTAAGGTITPHWTLHDSAGTQIGAGSAAGVAISGALLDAVQGDLVWQGQQSELAVGVIATSFGSSGPFTASWDHLKIYSSAAPPPPPEALALNAGGPAVTTGGTSYLADQYFTGGNTFSVTSAIAGTTDDAVYQTERYGSTFSYAVPVANGSYSVTLKFAELWHNAPGQRVFDVTAEGNLVVDNLDIFAAAGGKFIAKDVVVPVTVTDGVLNLQFVSSVDSAKIDGIQIAPAAAPAAGLVVAQSGGSTAVTEGGATDTLTVALGSQPSANVTVTVGGNADVGVAPTTLSFTTANWNQAQTVTVTAVNDTLVEGPETASVTFATSSTDPSYSNLAVSPVTVAVTDNDTAPQALAVNAGGPAVTTGGTSYLADQYFTGGNTFSVTSAIAGTTDDAVYQTERYGSTFSYAVPVANGSYSVTLKFAELWHNAPGQRVFDVTAEGNLVVDNLDIFAAAGGKFIAKDVVVPVTVTDGVLNLQFVSSVDSAKIDGIQIAPAAAPAAGLVVAQSGGSTAVTEGGATDTLTVALGSQPSANVTVTVGGNADVGVAPTTLSFTTANWNQAQTVTVTAVNDTLVEGPETASVTFATSSTDPSYSNLAVSPVTVAVTDNDTATPNFIQHTLAGLPDANYTSLQFGPDGRLYLAKVDGTILAFEVQATATGYQVLPGSLETISVVKSITNFNDDGSLAPGSVQGLRQVTGILVTSDASDPAKPVLYVSSSDPRIGAGPNDGDVNLDTNSGVVSRLTQAAGGGWSRIDLVRGLPRSEENHSVNGMALSSDGHTMYLDVGGNTNNGAPSHDFAYLPEFAYSAAIVSIDLQAIDAMSTKTDGFGNPYKYDLPTLPPGASDPYPNDPFGGRDGLSQARIVAGGPVQIYSPGYRNPYDIVLTEGGKLYTVDNGSNAGWGGLPIGEGTANVTNQVVDGGPETPDHLHLVTQGFYAGFPNPLRANPNGAGWYLDDSGNPTPLPAGWPPVLAANPVEGDFRAPGQDGALYSGWLASTNGLAEYRASAFGGAMRGDLLTVGFDDQLYRVDLSPDGLSALGVSKLTGSSTVLGSGVPLDVWAQPDGAPFAGLIFVANYGGGVTIFTPSNEPPPTPTDDTDGDGLNNAVDRFGEDPANGRNTDLAAGQTLLWSFSQNIDPPGPNGLFNMGFTGLMSNGVDSYLALYDPANIKPGGAASGFQIDSVGAGDASVSNSQQNGFQFGVDVLAGVGKFVVETKIDNPFGGDPSTPAINYKSQGFFIGSGDQQNYVKLVAAANGGAGGIELAWENAGVTGSQMFPAGIASSGLNSLDTITLRLTVDVAAGTATPSWTYTVGGAATSGSGATLALSGDTLAAVRGSFAVAGQPSALAVGTISTSFGTTQTFPAYWQYLKVTSDLSGATPGLVVAQSGGSTAVTEGGTTDTLSVSLTTQPTAAVSVTVGGNADVGVAPTTLSFTTANWNQAQTVTVTAVNDTLVEGPETASVTFATSSTDPSYSNLAVSPVTVAVTDNDTAPQALAVNAGGPAVTTGGTSYLADQYFTGGNTFSVTSAIAGTTDDAVYQTERYGSTFSYAVPVANGSYSVTLKFAELWHNAPGQRVFDVTAEGNLVVDNLDIFAAAGGKFIAKDVVVPVTVTDGVLNLQFVSSVDSAKIDGIQIAPAAAPAAGLVVAQSGGSTAVTEGGATDTLTVALGSQPSANVSVTVGGNADVGVAPTTLSFTTANWNQAQTVTVTAVNDTLVEGPETASVTFATSSTDPSYSNLAVSPVTVAVTDNDTAPQALALNAGGPAVTTGGTSYLADQYFTGGNTFSVTSAIAGTTDDAVYQTERYGSTFSYAVPVANGSYSVTLKFAELWHNAPGQRVFDVTAEGNLVVDNLDIFAAAGGKFIAKDVVVPVTVTDGVLNLQFVSSVDSAKIDGIQIAPAAAPAASAKISAAEVVSPGDAMAAGASSPEEGLSATRADAPFLIAAADGRDDSSMWRPWTEGASFCGALDPQSPAGVWLAEADDDGLAPLDPVTVILPGGALIHCDLFV